LIIAEMISSGETDAAHVAGWISHNGEVIEVLDLDSLTPGQAPLLIVKPASPVVEARP
jgi:hypothetical protein